LLLQAVALLAVLKIIATAVCYASGNAGGIFGPSLFIGAMIGASVGHVAHELFPATTAGAGAYALVGMGTAFAGIIRTPLTSVIMIFEVTRNYTIIVPLMISNLMAFYISQRFQREPIYEALARQDGLHLPTGEFRRIARQFRVSSALQPSPAPEDYPLRGYEASRPYAYWRERLQTLEGPWAPVQDLLEVADDPQVRANGYVLPLTDADGRERRLVANPVQFDEQPPELRRAPQFAEHTEEILRQLGRSDDEIIQLKVDGVCT